MYSELTNLLPLERLRVFARGYILRLSVVAVVLVNSLVLAAAVLLIPAYVFLTASASAKEARLASVESALSSANEQSLATRLTALTSDAAVLTALAKAPSASASIRTVLAASRPGITLSGFSYTPADGKIPSALIVSGVSATRDTLRNYQLTLQNTPSIHSVVLPVSAYAQDADISFTITLSLSP